MRVLHDYAQQRLRNLLFFIIALQLLLPPQFTFAEDTQDESEVDVTLDRDAAVDGVDGANGNGSDSGLDVAALLTQLEAIPGFSEVRSGFEQTTNGKALSLQGVVLGSALDVNAFAHNVIKTVQARAEKDGKTIEDYVVDIPHFGDPADAPETMGRLIVLLSSAKIQYRFLEYPENNWEEYLSSLRTEGGLEDLVGWSVSYNPAEGPSFFDTQNSVLSPPLKEVLERTEARNMWMGFTKYQKWRDMVKDLVKMRASLVKRWFIARVHGQKFSGTEDEGEELKGAFYSALFSVALGGFAFGMNWWTISNKLPEDPTLRPVAAGLTAAIIITLHNFVDRATREYCTQAKVFKGGIRHWKARILNGLKFYYLIRFIHSILIGGAIMWAGGTPLDMIIPIVLSNSALSAFAKAPFDLFIARRQPKNKKGDSGENGANEGIGSNRIDEKVAGKKHTSFKNEACQFLMKVFFDFMKFIDLHQKWKAVHAKAQVTFAAAKTTYWFLGITGLIYRIWNDHYLGRSKGVRLEEQFRIAKTQYVRDRNKLTAWLGRLWRGEPKPPPTCKTFLILRQRDVPEPVRG